MKIKHKIGFIALITAIDIFVIAMVVIFNGKTNIKNDVSTKTAAHVITSEKKENVSQIAASTPTEEKVEEKIEEATEEAIEEKKELKKEETKVEEKKGSTKKETKVEEKKGSTKKETKVEEKKESTKEETKVEESKPTEKTQPVVDNSLNSSETVENSETDEVQKVSFDDISLDEKNQALQSGTLALDYSGIYTSSNERLTKSKGVVYYNDHKETYYDEKVLPGLGLNIPGRHVADDGTIRDGEGYICVAANYDYMPKGSILITSLGPAKVYDTGCSYGTIDIYVNW